MLGLPGFAHESIEAVRARTAGAEAIAAALSNATSIAIVHAGAMPTPVLERVADVPIYFADPLVRRAASLQKTRRRARAGRARQRSDAGAPAAGRRRRRRACASGDGEAMLTVVADAGVPDGCVRIAAAHPTTSTLGPMFGPIAVEAVG